MTFALLPLPSGLAFEGAFLLLLLADMDDVLVSDASHVPFPVFRKDSLSYEIPARQRHGFFFYQPPDFIYNLFMLMHGGFIDMTVIDRANPKGGILMLLGLPCVAPYWTRRAHLLVASFCAPSPTP